MIDITRALAIPGFMTPKELTWLAEQAATHSLIVEVGSYLGRSTRALGDHTLGQVLAIDDWKGPRDVECDKKNLLKQFYGNLKDLIEAKKVSYHRWDHRDMPDVALKPDMVFFDGSHEYEDVKQDILFWSGRLSPGGLLCGHDIREFPGVTRAVHELVPDAKVAKGTDIWFWESV